MDETARRVDYGVERSTFARAARGFGAPRAERAEAQLAEVQAQLAAIQTQRASCKRRKRPTSPSPDWLLVEEEIRALLTLPVGDLATRLGLAFSTVLGKAQDTPVSPGLREKLLTLKREHLAATTAKP